jgi:hypothetical protein
MVDEARRAAAAAGIDAHADIIVRHPFLGIDHLPVLIEIARSRRDIRMLRDHALPRARIAILKGKTFRIGTVGEENRIAAVFHRTKDIGAQLEPVVHCDGDIEVDAHAVAHFAAMLVCLLTG